MLEMLIASLFGTVLTSMFTGMQQDNEFSQQKNLLEDEQAFQAEREDINWNRQRPQQMFGDYLASGFNPNLAAQSVMNLGGESAVSGSSPSAPNVNSAIGALSSALGQGNKQIFDSFKQAAEIENLHSQSNLQDVQAGIIPREFDLKSHSVAAQINNWNKQADMYSSQQHLNEEQTRFIQAQRFLYNHVTDEQIKYWQALSKSALADAAAKYESIKNMAKEREVMDSQIVLNGAKAIEANASAQNQMAQAGLATQQTFTEEQREAIEKMNKEYQQQMNGIPLTVDGKKMIDDLMAQGKYDDAGKLLDGVFYTALNQSFGSELGKPTQSMKIGNGLIGTYETKGYGLGGKILYGMPSRIPYWNPN